MPARTRWSGTSSATLADLFEVRQARTQEDVDAALRLRERVFAGEQGVPVEADRDGRDGEALHLVAFEDGEVVGTCRLVFRSPAARLGRLAVAAERRRRGIGAELLRAADREARANGAARIELHAQIAALELYERDGYRARGKRFLEQGIEHVAMQKELQASTGAGIA